MPSENGRPRTSVDELGRRLRSEMTPINNKFSYFLAAPVAEEDLRQYLQDPVEALPAAVFELLPTVGIVLAPFLERGSTRKLGQEVLIGKGDVDFLKVFQGLRAAGYTGAVTIERETSGPQQIADVREEKLYLERMIAQSAHA